MKIISKKRWEEMQDSFCKVSSKLLEVSNKKFWSDLEHEKEISKLTKENMELAARVRKCMKGDLKKLNNPDKSECAIEELTGCSRSDVEDRIDKILSEINKGTIHYEETRMWKWESVGCEIDVEKYMSFNYYTGEATYRYINYKEV